MADQASTLPDLWKLTLGREDEHGNIVNLDFETLRDAGYIESRTLLRRKYAEGDTSLSESEDETEANAYIGPGTGMPQVSEQPMPPVYTRAAGETTQEPFDISDFVNDVEADENGEFDIGPLRGQDTFDEFDKFANLKEINPVDITPGQGQTQERDKKQKNVTDEGKATEEAAQSAIPAKAFELDFITPGLGEMLKDYKNPYEDLKRAGHSGESSNGTFPESDDTYLWIAQLGGTFRDDDFTEYPTTAKNSNGFTMTWEDGDAKKWEEAWPELCLEVEDIERQNSKVTIEKKPKQFIGKLWTRHLD